ncbi:hypothetical protein [Arthrobacter mobilis]|uniref:Uncharacterized protein n=1 Tax=Arthrobacter mobilis TaxID=2724944 RepID=A0A7X6HGJ4_9MICC|nr:hypothetical protein [Arthrobacter mobilis]NKX55980.1 hypothetical protein [Arthrobacter mobilis]
MESPTGPQRAILGQIVDHAGNLASVLEAQFASCRTEPMEGCGECFDIEVSGDLPRLPEGTECPLAFGVGEGTGALSVLLWHEGGLVDGLEVNSVGHPHAALADLVIED